MDDLRYGSLVQVVPQLGRFLAPREVTQCTSDSGLPMPMSKLTRAQTRLSAPTQPRIGLPRFFVEVAQRFYRDRCLLHASALAYTSVLSLVPLLALMFAVLKGLGVQHRLEPVLLSRLALSQAATDQVIGYIDRTNVRTLGLIGALTLLFTVLGTLGQIEASMNDIWRVRESRAWWRKVSDYSSVVLLTPFLLLAAVALTSAAKEQAVLRWLFQSEYVGEALLRALRLAPVLMNIFTLAILYAMMPNRRPHPSSIVAGAVVAGCAWQLVQWAYVTVGVGAARYSAIYGAISQLPITLVWIYVSWAVVLAGAELAAVYEFGIASIAADGASPSRWAVAMHLLLRAAEGFRVGACIEVRTIARELHIDVDLTHEVAEQLREHHLLAALADTDGAYVLARDPHAIDLAGPDDLVIEGRVPHGCDPRVSAALEGAGAQQRATLRAIRLAEVLDAPAEIRPEAQRRDGLIPTD